MTTHSIRFFSSTERIHNGLAAFTALVTGPRKANPRLFVSSNYQTLDIQTTLLKESANIHTRCTHVCMDGAILSSWGIFPALGHHDGRVDTAKTKAIG